MDAEFQLVVVAFVQSTGGRMRLLLAVDRDGEPVFDGEPAVLVEHRPGAPWVDLHVETADAVPDGAADHVAAGAAEAIVALLDASFDRQGNLDRGRLLGSSVQLVAPRGCFGV